MSLHIGAGAVICGPCGGDIAAAVLCHGADGGDDLFHIGGLVLQDQFVIGSAGVSEVLLFLQLVLVL